MKIETSELTKFAISKLTTMNYFVWRQNQVPVKGRRFIGMKGLSDIQGYCKATGKAVYCEVKSKGDKLREEQINFLNWSTQAGCHTYLCKEENETALLMEWKKIEL